MAEEEADRPEGSESWLGSASAQFLVMTREADYHERYQKDDKLEEGEEIEWPVPSWDVDAGAALMLILLAAIAKASPRPCTASSPRPRRSTASSSRSRTTSRLSPQ
jgi:hypothetical protein